EQRKCNIGTGAPTEYETKPELPRANLKVLPMKSPRSQEHVRLIATAIRARHRVNVIMVQCQHGAVHIGHALPASSLVRPDWPDPLDGYGAVQDISELVSALFANDRLDQ